MDVELLCNSCFQWPVLLLISRSFLYSFQTATSWKKRSRREAWCRNIRCISYNQIKIASYVCACVVLAIAKKPEMEICYRRWPCLVQHINFVLELVSINVQVFTRELLCIVVFFLIFLVKIFLCKSGFWVKLYGSNTNTWNVSRKYKWRPNVPPNPTNRIGAYDRAGSEVLNRWKGARF